MNVLYLLIPIALLLLVLAIKILVWAVRSGQYDDLETEGKRILFDEDQSPSSADGDANKETKKAARKTKASSTESKEAPDD